jgi:molybdopterin converting factor small subunit
LTIGKDLSKHECRGVPMIEIHLYGNLRALVSGSIASEDTILKMEFVENETFAQIVTRLGLKPEDLGDCFINGNLAKSDHILADGDRIGLFPFNMVLLCGGQHLKGHGYTRKDVDVDYY